MKKIKYSFCVVLMAVIVFGYSPLESTATTLDAEKRHNSIIKTSLKESTNEMNNKKMIDEKMLLSPKYNCDPHILITNIPDIDPRILLNDFP